MAEEIVGVFDARCLMLEEHGVSKSCVLLLTHNRIVVGIIDGISLKLVAIVVLSAAVTFLGLFLKDLFLFSAGLVAIIVTGSLLGLSDFIVRYGRKNKVKKSAPEMVLKFNAKNIEILYSDVVKVRRTSFEKLEGGSRFFLPTLPELTHDIEFVTSKGRHVFILDRYDLGRCLNLLDKFVKEKIERNENEEF